MISNKMEKAFNDQVREEMYSAYLYLSMSAWFEAQNLHGFANWMYVQFQEEQSHALRFTTHILNRGGTVRLQALDAPPSEWKSPLEIFEASLKHEQHITANIDKLVSMSIDNKDHPALAMLQWFVTEQVEEENNADEVVRKLRQLGDNFGGLLILDQQLASRTFVPAPLE